MRDDRLSLKEPFAWRCTSAGESIKGGWFFEEEDATPSSAGEHFRRTFGTLKILSRRGRARFFDLGTGSGGPQQRRCAASKLRPILRASSWVQLGEG